MSRFKVGDKVRRLATQRGTSWPHGDATCLVIGVDTCDIIQVQPLGCQPDTRGYVSEYFELVAPVRPADVPSEPYFVLRHKGTPRVIQWATSRKELEHHVGKLYASDANNQHLVYEIIECKPVAEFRYVPNPIVVKEIK